MTISQLYQLFKNMSLRNITDDMQDKSDFIFALNIALQYLFSMVSQKQARYHNIVSEEVFPVDWSDGKEFQFSSPFIFHLEIRDWSTDDKIWKRNWSIDMKWNIDVSVDTEYQQHIFDRKSKDIIRTKEKYSSLKVIYARQPIWIDINAENFSEEVDCPNEYLGNVLMILLWVIFPQRLENWVTLANNYYSQHNELAQTLLRAYWLDIKETWFIPW